VGLVALRLGRISYVNMAPVFYRLDADVEEVQGVPTELNEKLLAGELDLAPISSIEYARHAERLRILPQARASSRNGIVSVTTNSSIAEAAIRATALPESTACVQ